MRNDTRDSWAIGAGPCAGSCDGPGLGPASGDSIPASAARARRC